MGNSLYGNVINPPKSFQSIKINNGDSITVENSGPELILVGDNSNIKIVKNNDNEIEIKHTLPHSAESNQTNIDKGELGGISQQNLTYIKSINVDTQGHIIDAQLETAIIKPVGQRTENDGEIFNDYNDNIAIDYAHAEGRDTRATGSRAHSEGIYTHAHGPQSHAEGQSTHAFGQGAHSEGYNTYTWANASHAEGNMGIAIGNGAHAEGYHALNYDSYTPLLELDNISLTRGTEHIEHESFKEILKNNQYYYFAFSGNKYIWYLGQYINDSLVLCPYIFDAYGKIQYQSSSCLDRDINNSTFKIYEAQGLAIGNGSHIEGRHTKAQGIYSHAGGEQSISIGHKSFAHGYKVQTIAENQVAFGKYNDINNSQNKLFQIGNGINEQNRADAFYVENNQTCAPDFVTYPQNNKSAIKLSEMPISLITSTNQREYTIKQGDKIIGTIPIALNAMVNKAEVTNKDNLGNEGTFIKLTVNTVDGIDELYISLNKILLQAQIKDTDTIDLNIDEQQVISGTVKQNSLEGGEQGHLAANTITTFNIDNIDGSKINSNTLPSSSIINNSIGAEQLADNAIGLNNLTIELQTTLNDKMEKNNPVGSGSFSMNRKPESDIGNYSAVLGYNNEAIGKGSFAAGIDNIANGAYSVAFGNQTKALGPYSMAHGWASRAEGEYSMAIGDCMRATGKGAFAQGLGDVLSLWKGNAKGDYSHSEGGYTWADGKGSHAEGESTEALADYSHAEGRLTQASGLYSHAEGYGTITTGAGSHAAGIYNLEDTTVSEDNPMGTYASIIGNGISNKVRSNAYTLDWAGNAWYAGTVEAEAIVLRSSTPGSKKKFALTIDDNGIVSVNELEETTINTIQYVYDGGLVNSNNQKEETK